MGPATVDIVVSASAVISTVVTILTANILRGTTLEPDIRGAITAGVAAVGILATIWVFFIRNHDGQA